MLRVALLRQKIVHRNLCLENILLDAKGQSLSLCLRITAGISAKVQMREDVHSARREPRCQ